MRTLVAWATMAVFLFAGAVFAKESGQSFFLNGPTEYKSPDGVLRMRIPVLSGAEYIVSEGFDPDDTTNDVAVLDRNEWMLAVIYTRIRADYHKDFGLIEEKVMPLDFSVAERYGPDLFQAHESMWGGIKVFETLNFRPVIDLPSDLYMLRTIGPGFDGSNKNNQRRVDVWFVRSGYLLQIVAVTNDKSKILPEHLMEHARKIARATFDHIVIDTKGTRKER